jgi:hypothetical protein
LEEVIFTELLEAVGEFVHVNLFPSSSVFHRGAMPHHTDILVDPLLLLHTLVSTATALLDAILVAGDWTRFSQSFQ